MQEFPLEYHILIILILKPFFFFYLGALNAKTCVGFWYLSPRLLSVLGTFLGTCLQLSLNITPWALLLLVYSMHVPRSMFPINSSKNVV